jgi:tetratricopeptide (TPR) repeat protein
MTIIGRHYEDETLIALIESADAETLARDPHLTSCDSCSDLAQTLRSISGALGHEDVWQTRELNETPRPETVANLRAFASDMAREDAVAERHLTDLLAGPRETWLATLHAHPEYRTGGMVRKLVAATDHALDTMPPDAVAITELATEIADHLAPATYLTDTVSKLRGAAWRERAYALFYIGSYAEAETAICASERHFSDCVVSDYDRGRDAIVHALIHRSLDRDADAIAVAGEAVDLLSEAGDAQRFVSAVMVQAQAKMKVFDYRGALALLETAVTQHAAQVGLATHALLLGNIGQCHRSLRDFASAIDSYRCAALMLDAAGVPTDGARVRANVAVVLREAGQPDLAAKETYALRRVFEELGMASDVAISGLVLAEIALENGSYHEVEVLCRETMTFFNSAGVPYGARALTALAYMTEAANQRRLTVETVRHVQKYIRQLPSQPALLYAPPLD